MKVALQDDVGCFSAHALGFTTSSELSTRPRKRKRIADENDNECAPNVTVLDCPIYRTISWGFTQYRTGTVLERPYFPVAYLDEGIAVSS